MATHNKETDPTSQGSLKQDIPPKEGPPGTIPGSDLDEFVEEAPPGVQQSVARQFAAVQTEDEFIVRSALTGLPSDFLVINDVAIHDAAVVGINVSTSADVFVGETLRTSAPVIQTKGTGIDFVNISIRFPNGNPQQLQLRRIMAVLLKHPFVFIENNKIREAMGFGTRTMMFVLHQGSLSADTGQIGVITLNLQLAIFDYTPFSNHFWFNSEFPVKSQEEERTEKTHGELLPGDFLGRSSYDFSILGYEVITAESVLTQTVGSTFTPVVYPSQSKSWMFYADHLDSLMQPISDTNKDYIGLEIREYKVFNPPAGARIGTGTAASVFSKHGRERVPTPFYDATAPHTPFIADAQPLAGQGGDGRTTQDGITETGAINAAIREESQGRKSYSAIIIYARRTEGKEKEFSREAKKFASKLKGALPVPIDIPPKSVDKRKRFHDVRAAVDAAFGGARDVSLVAFFCHGFPHGMTLYPGGRQSLGVLTDNMVLSVTNDVRVCLYMCSCALSPTSGLTQAQVNDLEIPGLVQSTDGSYADLMRDLLAGKGKSKCQVDAHLSAGHSTRNPLVVRFIAPTGTGGQWIVDPLKKPKLYRQWRKAMTDLNYDLRYRFPMMSTNQIVKEIQSYTGKNGVWLVRDRKTGKTKRSKTFR